MVQNHSFAKHVQSVPSGPQVIPHGTQHHFWFIYLFIFKTNEVHARPSLHPQFWDLTQYIGHEKVERYKFTSIANHAIYKQKVYCQLHWLESIYSWIGDYQIRLILIWISKLRLNLGKIKYL